MTVQVIAEGEVMHDVAEVLLRHLSPAKAVRFWASWHAEHGDYLRWRDEQFGVATVAALYEESRPINRNSRPTATLSAPMKGEIDYSPYIPADLSEWARDALVDSSNLIAACRQALHARGVAV